MLQKRLILLSFGLNLLIYGMDSSCDTHYTVEKDDTTTIQCIAGGPVDAHYWYKGSTSDSQPILLLKNGNKGGTKYNDGHYDITDEGYMKITNAQIEHEAVYTYTVIFPNRSTWTQTISIQVTVTPESPCPVIQFCTRCDECRRKILSNALTTLSCSIDDIRPKVELHWLDEGGKTLFNQSRSEVMNPLTHTWTISSSIPLKLEFCGEQRLIYCSVQNDSRMSSISNRTVIIFSEKCHHSLTTNPSSESSEKLPVVSVFIVCGFLLPIIVGICLIVWIVSTRHCLRKQVSSHRLKKVLKHFYANDVLPGNMELWYNNDRKYHVISPSCSNAKLDETSLLNTLEKDSRNHRVLFSGKAGIGKTCLLRHILGMWSNKKILKDQILIYLQVWQINAKTSLIEEIKEMLPSDTEISIDDIQQALGNRNTIIIVDGIRHLKKSEHIGEVMQDSSWNLLTKQNDTFPMMKVWVACREIDEDISRMYSVKIHMEDFDKNDISTNMERFVKTLNLTKSAESNQTSLRGEVCIDDQQKLEDHEIVPLVDKEPYNFDGTFISTVIKHLDVVIAAGEQKLFTHSFMSRLLILLYTYHNCQEEVEKKLKELYNFKADKPKVIDEFIKDENWEIVAYLLETGAENEEEVLDLAKDLHMKDVVFSHMTVDSHLQSLRHFFKVLTLSNTELLSLDICADNPLYVVHYLPSVKSRLVVRHAHLSETDLKAFIKAALKRSKTIEFRESDLLNGLKNIPDISSGERKTFNVCHTKDNNTLYFKFQEENCKSNETDENGC